MAASSPTQPDVSVVGPALLPLGHHEGKPPIKLTRPVSVIGSRSNARIHLLSSTVSKAHALLVRSSGRCYIRDLASRARLYVNDEIVREADLEDGDVLTIGSFTFRYIAGPGENHRLRQRGPVPMRPGKLEVSGSDFPVPVEERVTLIGRRPSCDIHLLEETVSTAHAVIFEMNGQRFVRDLGSRTGTFVNGVSTHQHQLAAGDSIRIGETDLRYLPAAPPAIPEPPQFDDQPAAAAPPTVTPHVKDEAPLAVVSDELDLSAFDLEPEAPSETSDLPLEPAAAPTQPPEPVASTDNALDLASLSAEPETSSAPAGAADTAVHDDDVSPATPLDTVPSAAETEAPTDANADVLKFPDSIPAAHDETLDVAAFHDDAAFAADDGASATAVLDVDLAPPASDEPASSPIGSLNQQQFDVELSGINDDAALASPADLEPIVEAPAVENLIDLKTSLPAPATAPGAELPQTPPTLDLKEAEVQAAAIAPELPVEDEVVGTPTAAESSALPLIATPDLSGVAPSPIEPAALAEDEATSTGKKSRGRKPRAPRKPRASKKGAPAAEEPIESAAPPASETIEQTEPTPDSALPPIVLAGEIPAAIESAGELTSAEIKPLETLTDTGFGRAIEEFSGRAPIGELVVEPSDVAPESVERPPVVEAPESASRALELSPPPADSTVSTTDLSATFDSTSASADDLALDALTSTTDELPLPADVSSETPAAKEVELSEPAAPSPALELPAVAPALERPAPVPQPVAPTSPWGANQDNFLGGVPLPNVGAAAAPSAPKPTQRDVPAIELSQTPIVSADDAAMNDLLAEIDTASAAAENAAKAPTAPPLPLDAPPHAGIPHVDGADALAPLIPALPPRPRRSPFRSPGSPSSIRRPAGPSGARPRPDESIPPFDASGDPTRGQITTGFDGLAMPPVRETDVFAQMSPPATSHDEDADTGAANDSDLAADVNAETGVEDAISESREQGAADAPRTVVPPRPARPRSRRGVRTNNDEAAPEAPTSFGEAHEIENGEEIGGFRRGAAVRPALPGPVEGAVVSASSARHPGAAYNAEMSEAEAAALHRRNFRRVSMLVGAMVLCIAAASWAVFNYVGVKSSIEGTVVYRNVSALTERERLVFQNDQLRRLKDDFTRRTARRLLNERDPEIKPAFLDDQVDYYKAADHAYFNTAAQRPDMLVIRVDENDANDEHGRARVAAMASALWDANSSLRDESSRAAKALADVNANVDNYRRKLDDISAQIDKYRFMGESRPQPEQIKRLEDQVAQLEDAWNGAVAAVKNAQADLDRAKSSATASTPAPANADANAPKPAGAAADDQTVASVADDEKLKALQAQFEDVRSKVDAARAATSQQTQSAKKSLDSALELFQQQVTNAQGMMNGSPEIAAYIQSAQKLQETTRELTDALIRRQEQQFGRLTELKDRLNEKMEQRRVETWQQDKELRDLMERQEILTRQYNAALGGGLQKEADDLKAQLELTKNMVKARQDLLPGDKFYSDAIQQIQLIIDSTKKNIDEDRAKTEQLLTSLQQSFVTSQSVEKLPEEQKQLAAALQKQLQQINAARQQYNAAVDTDAGDTDDKLRTELTGLQTAIDARRKELADANLKHLQDQQEQTRLAAVAVKQDALKKANDAEASARQAYFNKHKELRDAQALVADAKGNDEKLDALIRQKDVTARNLEENLGQLEAKKRDVDRAVEPLKPDEKDIVVRRGEDMRLIYTLASGGAILVLFCGLIVWTMHSAAASAPYGMFRPSDLRHDEPDAEHHVPPSDDSALVKHETTSDDDHEAAAAI